MFTQEMECQYCSQTRELVQELGPLNDKITVEVLDYITRRGKRKRIRHRQNSRLSHNWQKRLRRKNLRDTLRLRTANPNRGNHQRLKRPNRPIRKNQNSPKRSKKPSSNQSIRNPNMPPLPSRRSSGT